MLRTLLVLVAGLVIFAGPIRAAPQRIVSLNPCADNLLRALARPDQILAISHLSHDRRASSVPAAWAARYPGVGPRAEELVHMRADLVLGGPFVPRETARMARRLGVPLVTLPAPVTIAETRRQIADLAGRLGNPTRGAALIARIDRAVAAARPRDARRPTAMLRQPGGMVAGPGTLIDDLLAHAGFANAARHYHLRAWDLLGVEKLAADPPDLLFTPDGRVPHKALAGHLRTASFPPDLLWCGGPVIVDALARLSAARRALMP